MISRRQFLIGSAGVGLITAAAGVRHVGSYPDSGLTLQTLSNREVHIYRTIGRWMAPPSEDLPGHGGDDQSIRNIDRLIADVPEGTRTLLSALPMAFEHGPLLLEWGAKRMTDLDEEALDAYLHDWTTSTVTAQCQLMAALKTLFGFAYYERTDVLEAIRIPGVCVGMTTVE